MWFLENLPLNFLKQKITNNVTLDCRRRQVISSDMQIIILMVIIKEYCLIVSLQGKNRQFGLKFLKTKKC